MQYNYDIEQLMPTLENIASQSAYVLEIGPAQGNGSTIAFARGLERSEQKEKLFISVDIRDYMDIKPGLTYWEFIIGDSRLPSTVEIVFDCSERRNPDIIFIDTHHTYEQMKAELEVWSKIAEVWTVWLFHDTHMMGEYNHMTDAIKEFAAKYGWTYEDITTDHHGLGMMYANRRPQI